MPQKRRFGPSLGLFLLSLALITWPAHPCAAEAVGSPAGILKKGQWLMGLDVGGLFGRGLKGDASAMIYQAGHFRGYGLTDRLTLYGKIGGAYLAVDDPSIKKTDGSTTHRFNAGIVVDVGLNGRLWQNAKKDWEWDGSLHYLDIRAKHRNGDDGHWREGVLATSVAKSFGRLKPYVGAEYSMVHMSFKIRQNGALLQQGKYQAASRAGPFFGVDYTWGRAEDVTLNIESAYLDGFGLNVAVNYTF